MVEPVEESKRFADRLREIAKHVFRHESTILVIVLVGLIAVFGGLTNGITIGATNMINVLLQSSIRGVASVGQAFCMLAGGLDISIGGNALFCSILGSCLMTEEPLYNITGRPISMFLAIPMMLVAGSAWGMLNGIYRQDKWDTIGIKVNRHLWLAPAPPKK